MQQDKALFEREWGYAPELAKMLSGKKVPDHYFGPSSPLNNPFEKAEKTLKHAILLREHGEDILSEAQNIDHERRAQLRRDLLRLKERLLGWREAFSDDKQFTDELLGKLDRLP